MTTARIENNLKKIKSQLPCNVTLIAVSKRQSIEKIQAAMAAGQLAFGENQVQEAVEKIQRASGEKIQWHFIGTLQSNKTTLIAEHFDWVQSLCSLKHAKRLNDARKDRPLNILIQVNIDHEASKSGLDVSEVRRFAKALRDFPRLKLRGLMCIPEKDSDAFYRMKSLFDEMNAEGFELDTLSMGMSDDYGRAVEAGSTMVRIGSAIFGERA